MKRAGGRRIPIAGLYFCDHLIAASLKPGRTQYDQPAAAHFCDHLIAASLKLDTRLPDGSRVADFCDHLIAASLKHDILHSHCDSHDAFLRSSDRSLIEAKQDLAEGALTPHISAII